MILVKVSYKKKLIHNQIGITKDILILEYKRITKINFFYFKYKQLEPINFIHVRCNNLDFYIGLYFYESLISESATCNYAFS
jgi:hypothetical protein